MIKIVVSRDKKDFIWKFVVSGHANFREHGKDIICAAVSSISYNAINALFEIARVEAVHKIEDGYLECALPENIPEAKRYEVKIILETIVIGFKQIEDTYGKKYVSVMDREV